MADFTHTTQAAALAILGDRLGDPAHVQWPSTEVLAALYDSLRWWNLATTHDCSAGVFNSTAGTPLYQLSTVLRDSFGVFLRVQTVTDADVIAAADYHLAESAATDQFTPAQIAAAVSRARDVFLADTACVIAPLNIAVDAANGGLVDLPDNVVSIRRAVWLSISGRYSRVQHSDEQANYAFDRSAPRGTPRTYSQAVASPLQLRLNPPPAYSGTLRLLVTQTGPAVVVGAPQPLGVPDDYAPFVKYGALSILFSDVLSLDKPRAELYGSLHAFGLALAKSPVVILRALLDGVQTTPGAVAHVDKQLNGWEGMTRGRPRRLSVVGPDCVMLTPVPDSNPHSVALDVLRNMRLPAAAGDYLQIAREHLEPVYAMTVWLLNLRNGSTVGDTTLFASFARGAKEYANKQAMSGPMLDMMQSFSGAQMRAEPLSLEADSATSASSPEARGEAAAEKNARRAKTVAGQSGGGQ